MKRLVVLGLDGADWRIINPLVAEGALPNFARMISEGSHANLRSTIPALTAPAWTSIFTGVNPGKHGIFDFFSLSGGRFGLTGTADNFAPYLWEMMPDERHIAFNIPWCYPPRPCGNAVIVSGLGAPSQRHPFAHPPRVRDEILRLIPDYGFKPAGGDSDVHEGAAGKEKAAGPIMKSLRDKMNAARHLLGGREWESAIVVFSETDWMQHIFMHEFNRAELKSRTEVGAVYIEIDSFLGSLIEKYDILIVSDHGFEEAERRFFINSFLLRKGLLRLRRERLHKRVFRSLGLFRDSLTKRMPKSAYRFAHPNSVLSVAGALLPPRTFSAADIDHAASDAFLVYSSGGVFVREGVDISAIIAALESASDETGFRPVERVLRREQIYSGAAVPGAPRLQLVPARGCLFMSSLAPELSKTIDPIRERNGTHGRLGIFLSHGPGFRALGDLGERSLLDVAPTVLSYFGYSAPEYSDGKALPVVGGGGKPVSLSARTKFALRSLLAGKGEGGQGRKRGLG
ncbi:MAG: alkaline phosphatase family protein [Candidatus Micrarchaeota archaeon]